MARLFTQGDELAVTFIATLPWKSETLSKHPAYTVSISVGAGQWTWAGLKHGVEEGVYRFEEQTL
ncbi:MAG: hypothetical protein GX358_07160 [candidate division WS1 bacterium]|nr:hypothetical protein [candidate division WS1 bacterium]